MLVYAGIFGLLALVLVQTLESLLDMAVQLGFWHGLASREMDGWIQVDWKESGLSESLER